MPDTTETTDTPESTQEADAAAGVDAKEAAGAKADASASNAPAEGEAAGESGGNEAGGEEAGEDEAGADDGEGAGAGEHEGAEGAQEGAEEQAEEQAEDEDQGFDPIGEVIEGVVTDVDDEGAFVDLGDRVPEPGRVTIQDLGWSDRAEIGVGDHITVLVCGLQAGGESYRCSAAQADALSVWDTVQAVADAGDVIPTRVVAAVRGGASVDLLGMRGFLPQSQVDIRPVDDLTEIVGATLAVMDHPYVGP